MYQKTLNTILHNPSWWVRAFEVSSLAKAPHLSPMELSCESGTSPAFNGIELSGLSIVLSNIQKQIILGQERIFLDPVEHRKFASSTAKHRIFAFERILQILTGLQLLTGNHDDGFEVTSLFRSQSWKRHGLYQGLTIEVELSDLGAELILGYVEPYSDLCRFISKKPRVQRILQGQGPLRLWQSVWLDLQGIEQTLLLRLEKAMQWENCWLRLDGVFGYSFESLLQDLEIPKARGKSREWTPFRIKKRVVERLGRKLSEHGLLNFEQEQDFLPFHSDDDLSLVWQVASEYLNQSSLENYAALASKALLARPYKQNFESIVAVLAGNLFNSQLQNEITRLWEKLDQIEGDDFLGVIGNNIPISARGLFIEWFVRQIPEHQFSMKPFEQWHQFFKFADPKSDENIEPRFTKFFSAAVSDENLIRDLESVSGLSLISPKSQKDTNTFPYFMSLQNKQMPMQSNASPNLFTQNRITGGIVEARVDLGNRQKQLKDAAITELDKLRSGNIVKYEALKKAYIDTLDSEKKKIIMEVKERLQPKIFDDHLKNSLIRFMVDQPEYWISNTSNSHF